MSRAMRYQVLSVITMLTLSILSVLSCTSNESHQKAFSSSTIRAIDAIIQKHGIAGGTIVRFDKQGIKQYSFGTASFEKSIRWNDSTYFRIASISKVITALAVLQLIERKLFSLDSDISDILGIQIRNPYHENEKITIRMLLNHTSTIRDSDKAFDFAKKSIYIDTLTNDTVIPPIRQLFSRHYIRNDLFLPQSLTIGSTKGIVPKPGTFFHYTNLNYVILAWIIEIASQQSFTDYVQEHIFKPIHISAGYSLRDIPQGFTLATQYRRKQNTWVPEGDYFTKQYANIFKTIDSYVPGHNPFRFSPHAGLRIQAHDLALLMKGIVTSQKMISKSLIDSMVNVSWKSQPRNSKEQFAGFFQAWGLGVQIMNNNEKDHINSSQKKYIGHIGRANGAYSIAFLDPLSLEGYIIFMNGVRNIPKGDHGLLQCEKELITIMENNK